jgi:hypothetical protein
MPRPVLIKLLDKRKADTTSQIIGLENPLKASLRVKVFVIVKIVSAKKEAAPIDKALLIKATIKPTKIASRFQAFGSRLEGMGSAQIKIPMPIESARGKKLAPLKKILGGKKVDMIINSCSV